jgi:PhnB protein
MNAVNPYLNFAGDAEEAFTFYRSVFGGDFAAVMRFRDFGDNTMDVPEGDLDKIAHIALPLGAGHMLMASDTLPALGHSLKVGNNAYISLEADTADEADKLFNALADGGRVEMPMQQTMWAEKYGICADKFGVQWMMSYTGDVQFGGGQPS